MFRFLIAFRKKSRHDSANRPVCNAYIAQETIKQGAIYIILGFSCKRVRVSGAYAKEIYLYL